jgi:hypothetical protein
MQLQVLHSALVLLKHNILTFEILPLAHARTVMQEIEQHVSNWPLRFLLNSDPLSLYKEADISYFRTASHLHIGLKVKVSFFRKPLHLFRVEKFALSFPNQGHSTIIQNLPEYVAINDYDSDYLVFHQKPSLQKDRYYFLENEQHDILSKQVPTCLMALFNDQLPEITRFCDTFLQPFSKQSVMRYMGANMILLSNVPNYEVITSESNSTTVYSNCSACLKTVPCGSKIQAGSSIVLIPNCPSMGQGKEVAAHLINLQVLAPLLDSQLLQELSAEFTFGNPINVTLPNITVFKPQDEQKLSEAFRTLGIQTIHLTTAINHSLSEGLIFQSPSDHIVYKLSEQGIGYRVRVGWESFTNWLSDPFGIVTKVITLLQWIALGYLLYKVHILSTAMAIRPIAVQALRQANVSHTQKLEGFFQRQNTPSTPPVLFEYKPEVSTEYHVLDFCMLVTLIAIAIYLVIKFTTNHMKRNSMQLFVDIVGAHDNVLIALMTLPHNSTMYKFKATTFVESVSVTGFLRPRLTMIWPTFVIRHKLLSKKQRLPQSCNITPLQAIRLQRILKSSFELLLFVRDGTSPNYRLVPLEGSTWKQIQAESRTITNSSAALWHTNDSADTEPPQYV